MARREYDFEQNDLDLQLKSGINFSMNSKHRKILVPYLPIP
jgi:hypothetical protein